MYSDLQKVRNTVEKNLITELLKNFFGGLKVYCDLKIRLNFDHVTIGLAVNLKYVSELAKILLIWRNIEK